MQECLDLQTSYRAILEAARDRRYISYGDLAKANSANWSKVRFKMNTHLGELMKFASERDWPLLGAIVVDQSNLQTGTLDGSAREGFITAAKELGFYVQDPSAFVEEQRQALFSWAPEAPDDLALHIDAMPTTPATGGANYVKYFGPVLDALRALGGAAEPKSVIDKVAELADISRQEISETYKGGRPKLPNQVQWARFYLVKVGLIDGQQRGRWALTAEGRETHLDQVSATALFDKVQSLLDDTTCNEDDPPPTPPEEFAGNLFDDPERSFWFVGALWGKDDQTERFLSEGIWANGYEDKFGEHVQRMKPGDGVAIKAAFTRKYGLPFENHNKSVSCMRIKAIGTVIEATQDGQTVRVEWTRLDEPKEWYFYTYRVTIVEADVSDELSKRLIRFTFGEHRQDYDFWLRQPYWAKKYRSSPEAVVDAQFDEEEADTDREEVSFDPYSVSGIVDDGCFLPEAGLTAALASLRAKMNLILQGPPGTGKTWLAKRLAYALIGTRDRRITRKRMRAIQFHPSLSYEDFVRGWHPDGNGGLRLTDGVFLESVEAARAERK